MEKWVLLVILFLLLIGIVSAATVEDKVTEQLDKQEEVRVIVKLNDEPVSASLEVTKISGQGGLRKEVLQQKLSQKKMMIKNQQDKVLSRLESKKILKAKGRAGILAKKDEFFELKHRYSTVNAFSGEITKEALEELRNDPDVESIQIDSLVKAFLDVSVPKINATTVWGLTVNGTNITGAGETVCIIDTGVDYNHSDLGGGWGNKVIGGFKSLDSGSDVQECASNNSDCYDGHGHGTHVAGIIASTNSVYKGVAPDAKIVAIKALNDSALGWFSDFIAGIDWCVDNASKFNISVISMSIGSFSQYSSYCDVNYPVTADAINTAVGQGIFVVVASGNNGNTTHISSPACIANATSIGSVDNNDVITSYTNRGNLLDMLAPGGTSSVKIISLNDGGGTIGMWGTSMATPHAAGAVALLQQFSKLQTGASLTNQEIKDALNNTGKRIDDSGGSGYNFSRIDVYAAIQSLDAIGPVVNFISPTSSNGTIISENSYVEINITANDSLNNISSCIFEFNSINYTMSKTGSGTFISCYINKSLNGSGILTYIVYANDSKNNFGSALRQIRINHISNVSSAAISSTDSLNRTNGTLTGSFSYSDQDNDTIVSNETRWYNDSVEVSLLKNLTSVGSGNTTKNEVWIFSVRVYDGANWSSWYNSSNFTVQNAAPVLEGISNISVNETGLVNITASASDIDGDNSTYGINDSRFSQTGSNFTWQTNMSDSGTYTVRINVTDGIDIDYQDVVVTVLDASDFDNDGNPDFNDTDDDNDGISDVNDTLTGNVSDINSTIAIKLRINGSENMSQVFNNSLLVNITDANNNTLVEFNWNFSDSTLVVNWTIDYNATAGTIRIKNLDLTSQGVRKTVYINKSSSNYNYICIADDETTDISSLDSSCTGYTKVACTGSSGQYSCTDLGDIFKVSGLDHSTLKGIQYTPPSPPSGGGGGSSRVTTAACTESWNCTGWGKCFFAGFQTRSCKDLDNCGTIELKPSDMQDCIPEIVEKVETITVTEEISKPENVTELVEEAIDKKTPVTGIVGGVLIILIIIILIYQKIKLKD